MNKGARILISGGGVAGLTAAIWLGRHGFKPTVVEKAPEIRADGYVISISHNAYHFAQELGLTEDLRESAAGHRASSYHDASGRALLKLDYGPLFQRVDVAQLMRDDFARLLYRHAKELADFRYSTSIESVAQDGERAEVRLSDGYEGEYDVVIGADGVHSQLRELAFPTARIQRHKLGLACAAFRLPNILDLHNKFETHMERDRYLVVFSTPDGEMAAVFVWASDRDSVPAGPERAQVLRQAFDKPSAICQRVLEHVPGDGNMYMDALAQVELADWTSGACALVGDAAHCMTLFSGQGASAAFSGASHLAKALIETDRASAFSRYQNALREPVTDMQRRTRGAAWWYVPRSFWREAIRNWGMFALPNEFFRQYFRIKYSRV